MPSQPAGSEGWTTFGVVCPGCGVDADDPDIPFRIEAWADVPHSDYWLAEALCPSCGTSVDICLWLISKSELLRAAGATGPPAPFGSALSARFRQMVDDHRFRWVSLYRGGTTGGEDHGRPEIDLSHIPLSLHQAEVPPIGLPADVLAAARGVREAVLLHAGCGPAGALAIGPFLAVLSLDRLGPAQQHVLHLSISVEGHQPSELDQAFLLSLFFAPDELPLLSVEFGPTQRVLHFRLEIAPSDLVHHSPFQPKQSIR